MKPIYINGFIMEWAMQETQQELNKRLVEMLHEVTKLLPRHREEYRIAWQKLEEAKYWILRCRK